MYASFRQLKCLYDLFFDVHSTIPRSITVLAASIKSRAFFLSGSPLTLFSLSNRLRCAFRLASEANRRLLCQRMITSFIAAQSRDPARLILSSDARFRCTELFVYFQQSTGLEQFSQVVSSLKARVLSPTQGLVEGTRQQAHCSTSLGHNSSRPGKFFRLRALRSKPA